MLCEHLFMYLFCLYEKPCLNYLHIMIHDINEQYLRNIELNNLIINQNRINIFDLILVNITLTL